MRRRGSLLHACLATLLVAGACGGPGQGGQTSATSTGANRGSNGALTVFAASSLTEPFTEAGRRFEAIHHRAKVTFNFGASSALADQITAGSPADVVATADEASMKKLTTAGLVDKPEIFARNRLAILVAKGNPRSIRSLKDLEGPGLTLVLCAAEVPCGDLAGRALAGAGVDAKPKSYEPNVKAVVSRVTLGEADAGIVYVTDVKAAGDKAEGVDIPLEQNLTTSYPIARLKRGGNTQRAAVFISYVLSPAGRQVLTDAGFAAP